MNTKPQGTSPSSLRILGMALLGLAVAALGACAAVGKAQQAGAGGSWTRNTATTGGSPQAGAKGVQVMDKNAETAILGGGCFWCLEAVFEEVPGVLDVTSGYAGGTKDKPSYEEVSTGDTGHAEVVRITFDPKVVSYKVILDYFWKIHDPTTLDRQGADVGSQYRSVIFWQGPAQEAQAKASVEAIGTTFQDPVVTEVLPAPAFWVAEDYHQDYFRNHPSAAYCQIVIAPKLKKAGF